MRKLLGGLADVLRGVVRCLFPLASLAAWAGLLFCAQGRDVLAALLDAAGGPRQGDSIAGLSFLATGSTLLALSVWYTMRWLLTAEMAALPLRGPPGFWRRWLPRAGGAAVPLLVALALAWPSPGRPPGLSGWVPVFALLALALVLLLTWRGHALLALRRLGWALDLGGRDGHLPGHLGLQQALPPLTQGVIGWSLGLTALTGSLLTLFPVTLPRVVGAASVAALALASINLFGSFVLTYWPMRRGLPPLAPWALGVAALFGAWNDNHAVATVDGSGPPGPRPVLEQDFARFLAQQPATPGLPPVVVFIASEGGGLRAAYWTAAVLQVLAAGAPALFQRQVYAVSGVSGGSLGLAAWLLSRQTQYCPALAAGPVPARHQQAGVTATTALAADFVAPAVAGLLYADLLQRFLPWPVPAFDRSRAIEEAWRRAFAHLPGQPFALPLDVLQARCPDLPRLLLNATVVETGQRAVLGPLAADAGADQRCDRDALVLNAWPAMAADLPTRRQPLAGLVHHSARFPVVSPAGTVERTPRPGCPSAFRLVDGGYFDNSGAMTVLDLIDRLQTVFPGRFEPLVLLVRNDPAPLCAQRVDASIAPGRWAPELSDVVGALAAARGSHAVAARAALARAPVRLIDVAVGAGTEAAQAPLGWALSDRVRAALDAEALRVGRQVLQRLARGEGAAACAETGP